MEKLLRSVREIIPPLSYSLYKGQAGRVTVVGGCSLYTGAPYYAGMTALKAGCDLSFVVCTAEAAVMKAYSPELMIYPILEESKPQHSDFDGFKQKVDQILNRSHTLVIGPGLGRDELVIHSVKYIIEEAKGKNLNLVIDGDGLFLVTSHPETVSGYSKCVITPNKPEYDRLSKKIFGGEMGRKMEEKEELKQISSKMGNVTIIKKGLVDLITDGENVIEVDCEKILSDLNLVTNPRRCGGIGDVLSGSLGTFITWSEIQAKKEVFPMKDDLGEGATKEQLVNSNYALGAVGGCVLTKVASAMAFQELKRGMTTPNIINYVPVAFEKLFPGRSEPVE